MRLFLIFFLQISIFASSLSLLGSSGAMRTIEKKRYLPWHEAENKHLMAIVLSEQQNCESKNKRLNWTQITKKHNVFFTTPAGYALMTSFSKNIKVSGNTRMRKQCLERWNNHLNPNLISPKEWGAKEKTLLYASVSLFKKSYPKLSVPWTLFSKILSEHRASLGVQGCRSNNHLQNRWASLNNYKRRKKLKLQAIEMGFISKETSAKTSTWLEKEVKAIGLEKLKKKASKELSPSKLRSEKAKKAKKAKTSKEINAEAKTEIAETEIARTEAEAEIARAEAEIARAIARAKVRAIEAKSEAEAKIARAEAEIARAEAERARAEAERARVEAKRARAEAERARAEAEITKAIEAKNEAEAEIARAEAEIASALATRAKAIEAKDEAEAEIARTKATETRDRRPRIFDLNNIQLKRARKDIFSSGTGATSDSGKEANKNPQNEDLVIPFDPQEGSRLHTLGDLEGLKGLVDLEGLENWMKQISPSSSQDFGETDFGDTHLN